MKTACLTLASPVSYINKSKVVFSIFQSPLLSTSKEIAPPKVKVMTPADV